MSGEFGENDLNKNIRLIVEYLPQETYFRHSDIDLFINITITQLFNFKTLLTEELNNFIQENYGSNYDYFPEIKEEKEKLLRQYAGKTIQTSDNQKIYKDTLLSYDFPEFEIYFIAKLFVDGMERKPECWTKLLFNSKNINQYISMRYKYQDLTIDSYILLELYSMTTLDDKNLLGTTKIYLFNENLNLEQGRHVFKLNKELFNKENNKVKEIKDSENDNKREDELDEVGKELDSLINSFYGAENEETIDYYGKNYGSVNTNEKFEIKSINERNKNISEKYYYNKDLQKPMLKTDKMHQFDQKLEQLLTKTENAYVVIKFPSFTKKVIYEEAISKSYIKTFKNIYLFEQGNNKNIIESDKKKPYFKYTTSVYDPFINMKKKDFTSTENPVQAKFSVLARRADDDLIARERRLNPYDKSQMDEVLNMPDFIEMESKNTILFWSHRYELLKKNTPYALTKIMNSVRWGDIKSENEFISNILRKWKTVEICDILYMLSRKFSVNKMYPNTNGTLSNFEGMKLVRKYAKDISMKKIDSPLVNFLIERCCKDVTLASSFFWFIECESDVNEFNNNKINSMESNTSYQITKIFGLIRDKFFEVIKNNKKVFEIINNELSFKSELVKISTLLKKISKAENKKNELRNIIDLTEKYNIQEKEYYLPINPALKVKGVITNKCTVFKSAKYPVKYSFNVTPDTKEFNNNEDKDHISIMFKYGDDLRQDQLVLQMINYMDSILKKIHLDYEFTIYKTLATSKSDGFVEFVPDSKTIFDIKNTTTLRDGFVEFVQDSKTIFDIKNTTTLREYIYKLSNNNETVFNKKLESYINSCAGYCVVTFLLGIGDRHLENLMIDKNGRLFHIDFGYILGRDPKPLPPPIKLCKEMVDCMGGKGSKNYLEFQQKCVNAYWVLREKARDIVNMFYLMIDSGIPELNNIDNLKKLHEKFVPQKNKQEAANYILDNLKESVDAVFASLMETFHSWAQYMK